MKAKLARVSTEKSYVETCAHIFRVQEKNPLSRASAFLPSQCVGRGETALHEAAGNGRAEVVELLLTADAPLDVENMFTRQGLSSPSWRVTVSLEICPAEKSFVKTGVYIFSCLLLYYRSMFFDSRSLNDLVGLTGLLARDRLS